MVKQIEFGTFGMNSKGLEKTGGIGGLGKNRDYPDNIIGTIVFNTEKIPG